MGERYLRHNPRNTIVNIIIFYENGTWNEFKMLHVFGMMGVKVVHLVDPEYIFNFQIILLKIKILLYIGLEKRKKDGVVC